MKPDVRFGMGELVYHRLFGYRGVVYDVDATFQGTEAWYEQMAKSKPPRDRPWYHVLVHDSEVTTYVAERNLDPDVTAQPIKHPLLDSYFERLSGGRYVPRGGYN